MWKLSSNPILKSKLTRFRGPWMRRHWLQETVHLVQTAFDLGEMFVSVTICYTLFGQTKQKNAFFCVLFPWSRAFVSSVTWFKHLANSILKQVVALAPKELSRTLGKHTMTCIQSLQEPQSKFIRCTTKLCKKKKKNIQPGELSGIGMAAYTIPTEISPGLKLRL